MELRHLRYFVAVAETEHFGRAAERLHVSQPALSQQIADLERELGAPLFTRLPRGVRLSEAGRLFLGHARAALAAAAAGAAQVRDLARGAAGALTVGLPEAAAPLAWVLPRLERFRRERPGLDVTVSDLPWLAQPRAVLAGELDLGFAWSIDPPGGVDDGQEAAWSAARHAPGLAAQRLLDDPGTHALVPLGHPLAAAPRRAPAAPRTPSDGTPNGPAPDGRAPSSPAPNDLVPNGSTPHGGALAPAALAAYALELFDRDRHPPLYDAILRGLAALGVRPARVGTGVVATARALPAVAAARGWTVCTRSVADDPPAGAVARPIAGLHLAGGLDVVWRADDARPAVRALVAALGAPDGG